MGPMEWEAIDRIPGFMSKVGCEWLAETARRVTSWMERGAYCGRSMLCIGLHLPPGASLRVVDLYLGSIRRAGQSLFTMYDELVQRRPDIEIVLLRSDSAKAASLLPDSEVVFLDASHEEEAVAQGIRAWAGKLDLLCGHDYAVSAWPGIKLAVDRLVSTAMCAAETIWKRG